MFYFACEHNTQIKKGLKNTTSTSEVANLLLMLNYSRSLTQLTSHTAIVVRILSVQHEHQEPSEIYSYLITRQLLRRYRDQREQQGKLGKFRQERFQPSRPATFYCAFSHDNVPSHLVPLPLTLQLFCHFSIIYKKSLKFMILIAIHMFSLYQILPKPIIPIPFPDFHDNYLNFETIIFRQQHSTLESNL